MLPRPSADEAVALRLQDIASALDAGLSAEQVLTGPSTVTWGGPARWEDGLVAGLLAKGAPLAPHERATLEAAERAGKLPDALRGRATARHERAMLARELIARLRYPVFLLLFAMGPLLMDSEPSPAPTGPAHTATPTESAAGVPLQRFVVIDDAGSAPLRRSAGATSDDSVIARVPVGQRLQVLGQYVDKRGLYPVIYYNVRWKSHDGWVSQYVTTMKMISVDPKSGRKTVTDQPDGAGTLGAALRS